MKTRPPRIMMFGRRRELLVLLVSTRPGIHDRRAAKALGCTRAYVGILCRELGIVRLPTRGGYALLAPSVSA